MTDMPSELNPEQNEILTRLRLIGPGPAAFFLDACHIYNDPYQLGLETATHLIAHCLREVESAIRDILRAFIVVPTDDASAKAGHLTEVRAILDAYQVDRSGEVGQAWLDLANRSEQHGLARLAHRSTLQQPRSIDEGYQEFYSKTTVMLKGITQAFEAAYLDQVMAAERLVRKLSPTNNELQQLKGQVPNNPALQSHLFSLITSPSWLERLWDKGFFVQPPSPFTDPITGNIQYPLWPPVDLLVRFGAQVPQVALQIIRGTKTDNPAIIIDFIRTILSLPDEMAVQTA